MSTQTVYDLLGEDLAGAPLGADLIDQSNLVSGYIPERAVVHIGLTQIGDGLAGPENDQQLYIGRDNRPLAVDELGLGHLGKLARHRAGRAFPLNYDWSAGIDRHLPGRVPEQDVREMSPLYWGQDPSAHDGFQPVEVLPSARTVFYTATPNVGWQGY